MSESFVVEISITLTEPGSSGIELAAAVNASDATLPSRVITVTQNTGTNTKPSWTVKQSDHPLGYRFGGHVFWNRAAAYSKVLELANEHAAALVRAQLDELESK